MRLWLAGTSVLLIAAATAIAGEKQIVSLKDMHEVELRSAGIELMREAPVHIKALGGGGDYGWTHKSDEMFAYAWILNADTRDPVWTMTVENTSKAKDDRVFDGTITLPAGAYEVYFTVPVFSYHSPFTNLRVNVDHRRQPLWGDSKKEKKNFFNWLTGWWSDDIAEDWDKRAKKWGVELLVDESVGVASFTPPKERPAAVLKALALGDNEVVRKGFAVNQTTTMNIYAIGEALRERELDDYGWIVSTADRKRVWEMQLRNCSHAGGAKKNVRYTGAVTLPRGEYVLYYVTDGSHSTADWNDIPPSDPLNWGVTLMIPDEKERKSFRTISYAEDHNVIVSLIRAKDNDYLSAGFTLKDDAKLRVYAFGERGSGKRTMADYGTILDAKTRNKVWTMDFDRTSHAGGDAKNRYIDEIITLPRGSYLVTYQTDDSHSFEDWNADPPFDPEHYGITVMGSGEKWNPATAASYTEEREKNIIAQIIRPGDGVDLSEKFTIEKTTRIRIFAIGEGQNREMFDYGWIEDARTGSTIWEMTYGMTFHAGGGRKNRMVNTTILLERGEYRLRFKSDDSHSFGDWNVDPPDDPQEWGITLYREDAPLPPSHPTPPVPPEEPRGADQLEP